MNEIEIGFYLLNAKTKWNGFPFKCLGENSCSSNNSCDDLCLAIPKGGVCLCRDGFQADSSNNGSCTIPSLEQGTTCDPLQEFQCRRSGTCIGKRFLCDRFLSFSLFSPSELF